MPFLPDTWNDRRQDQDVTTLFEVRYRVWCSRVGLRRSCRQIWKLPISMLAYVGLLIGLYCGTCSAQMLTDHTWSPIRWPLSMLSSFRRLFQVSQFTSAPVGSSIMTKDGTKTDGIERRENVNTSLCSAFSLGTAISRISAEVPTVVQNFRQNRNAGYHVLFRQKTMLPSGDTL